ncbi:MAG: hypothetical protein LW850_24985 [Planctomycetaceae bacterium]|jgi:hypothetical protein|nr:hypothetical protein [Planctomycetaceae bacterium]
MAQHEEDRPELIKRAKSEKEAVGRAGDDFRVDTFSKGLSCLLGQSFDQWQAWRADDRRFGRFSDQCES